MKYFLKKFYSKPITIVLHIILLIYALIGSNLVNLEYIAISIDRLFTMRSDFSYNYYQWMNSIIFARFVTIPTFLILISPLMAKNLYIYIIARLDNTETIVKYYFSKICIISYFYVLYLNFLYVLGIIIDKDFHNLDIVAMLIRFLNVFLIYAIISLTYLIYLLIISKNILSMFLAFMTILVLDQFENFYTPNPPTPIVTWIDRYDTDRYMFITIFAEISLVFILLSIAYILIEKRDWLIMKQTESNTIA